MMRKTVAAALWAVILLTFGLTLLFLAACEQQPAPRVVPTRHDTSFTLHVQFLAPERAAATCADYGVNETVPNRVERGCTLFHMDTMECEVIVPMPERLDDQRTLILGHEVLHCALGRYHQ